VHLGQFGGCAGAGGGRNGGPVNALSGVELNKMHDSGK